MPVAHNGTSRFYRFGEYRLDAVERILERAGKEVPLTPTLFEILLTLVEASGRILAKDQFMEKVWPGRIVEEGNLARNVSTLRKVLKDDPQQPRYIETVPRRGYRFVSEVEVEGEPVRPGPEQASAAEAADGGHDARRRGGAPGALSGARAAAPGLRKAFFVAGALLVVIALAASRFDGGTDEAHRTAQPIRSLVVLPLADLSKDGSDEFFADGMTDALITNLGRIGLTVISRTSAMHYKSTRKRPPEIARELGVDAVVEGSVMRSASRVRIAIQLIDPDSDRSLLSESYERDLVDVLAMQGEVARSIAQRVEIAVAPEERRRLAAATPVSAEAHEAYLRGLFLKNKQTVESLHDAIAYFEQALEIEPDFAPAYAAMADSYVILASWQGPSRSLWPKAREAANRALEIDATLADAQLVRAGALLCHDLNHAAADPVFLRALQLNPSHPASHRRYAYSLMTQGRVEESIAHAKRALAVDPVSLPNSTALARVYHYARRPEEALRQLHSTLELDDGYSAAHRYLGLVYLSMDLPNEAIRELEEALASGAGPGVVGELAYAYGVAGRREEALRELETLQAWAQEGRDTAFSFALLHHGLGETDSAFAWLHKAYEERDFRMVLLLVDPIWDSVREDPRFRQLLLQIGLGVVPSN